MKKLLIIIFGLLINFNAFSQATCPSGTAPLKAKYLKVCRDTVTDLSILNTVIADSLSCTQVKIGGVTIANPPGGTTTFLRGDGTFAVPPGTGGSGSVTSVSVVTANGVSGSVATSTTTPAITLTLGAIAPSSVNSVVISGSATPTLSVTGTSTISGTNTGDQTNITGNAATVTTNANLTGPITSVGNATSVAAQTGTGSTFVMNTSPSLITPTIGAASGTSLTLGVNISAPSWTTSGIKLRLSPVRLTNTTSSGTVSAQYDNVIGGDTLYSLSATTLTSPASVFIKRQRAGTNITISNMYALAMDAGIVFPSGSGDIIIRHMGSQNMFWGTSNGTSFNINSSNRVFIGGLTSASAILHLAAGTATANTAPLKFTRGAPLTIAEQGAWAYGLNGRLFFSPSTTWKNIPVSDTGAASNGKILIGNGTDYTVANITQGINTIITNGSGSIVIDADTSNGSTKLATQGDITRAIYRGTVSQVGTATSTFTVTIGATMANTNYRVSAPGALNVLSAAVCYINNKTTTTFDVVYLTGLTGTVAFDWHLVP